MNIYYCLNYVIKFFPCFKQNLICTDQFYGLKSRINLYQISSLTTIKYCFATNKMCLASEIFQTPECEKNIRCTRMDGPPG